MNGKINAFISNKLYSKIPVGGIRNRLYSVLLNAENIKIGWNIHIDNINNIVNCIFLHIKKTIHFNSSYSQQHYGNSNVILSPVAGWSKTSL